MLPSFGCLASTAATYRCPAAWFPLQVSTRSSTTGTAEPSRCQPHAITIFNLTLQDAPYLLEPLVTEFPTQALRVRLALLSAIAKLFFARPPECQGLLGSALAAAAADTDQDVHDRGLLYYRWP